jgi:hypothetical protein
MHHLLAWKTAVPARLRGEVKELHGADDWPPVTDASETTWRACLENLRAKHNALVAAVRAFPEAKLNDMAPARDHSYYVLLHGIVQHDLYHAGQIAILKKALARG